MWFCQKARDCFRTRAEEKWRVHRLWFVNLFFLYIFFPVCTIFFVHRQVCIMDFSIQIVETVNKRALVKVCFSQFFSNVQYVVIKTCEKGHHSNMHQVILGIGRLV